MTIRRALLSVSNKDGIVNLAKALAERDVEIISTGGTATLLREHGVEVTDVVEVSGFPEILDGRVKTLHPKIHGGILARRNKQDHLDQLTKYNIQPIDLVVVNLYPFKNTILKQDVTLEEAIENIDIGGPTMLRAAAKNHQDVTVVVDPNDYEVVKREISQFGNTTDELRKHLAIKVFSHTAQYDALIANFLIGQKAEFPDKLTMTYEKVQTLRYGENPHQKAAFYKEVLPVNGSLTEARQLHGKELSYNNINDANAALDIVKEFNKPAVVAVKHMNPCGVGVADTLELAFDRAYEADPVSIFGGIVALNREVDQACALKMKEIFLEIIIAPSFSKEALEILTLKKNIRLLVVDMQADDKQAKKFLSIKGGLLVQEEDYFTLDDANLTMPTKKNPSDKEWEDLILAWQVVKHVKSNAILLVKDQMTIGVGAGQMNRVGAAEIAIKQAGKKSVGAVMASDAFFPMEDTVEAAAKAGITAIIQPGGSIRDEDSIKKCDEYGITMVFTGVRHFKH